MNLLLGVLMMAGMLLPICYILFEELYEESEETHFTVSAIVLASMLEEDGYLSIGLSNGDELLAYVGTPAETGMLYNVYRCDEISEGGKYYKPNTMKGGCVITPEALCYQIKDCIERKNLFIVSVNDEEIVEDLILGYLY